MKISFTSKNISNNSKQLLRKGDLDFMVTATPS